MDTTYFLGIPLKRELDIGHLLTSLTLFAGFLWWLYTAIREMRRASRKEAESGALRLLLWLLREKGGQPIALDELRSVFNSPELKDRRRVYCKNDFLLRTPEMLERAVYTLDWEGKIDFVGTHSVAFRIDKTMDDINRESAKSQLKDTKRLVPTDTDLASILHTFREALNNANLGIWELRDVSNAAWVLAPKETTDLVREALDSPDPKTAMKAASTLAQLSLNNN